MIEEEEGGATSSGVGLGGTIHGGGRAISDGERKKKNF